MTAEERMKAIPLNFEFDGTHYVGIAIPYGAPYLDGYVGWFTTEFTEPLMTKNYERIGSIIHHPHDGWISSNQFCPKALIAIIINIIAAHYGFV